MDLGGPPYLLPLPRKEKLYDLAQLSKRIDLNEGLIIGAGAGPWSYVGVNCEVSSNK